MKFKKTDIQLITISLAIGAIAAIIAKLLHLSALIPLGAILLTTMVLRSIKKYTYKIYRINMQFTFAKYEHILVFRLVGIDDEEINIAWITVRKLGYIVDISKISQSLADHGVIVDETGCLYINETLLQSNNIIDGLRMLVQAKETIFQIVGQSMCNAAISIAQPPKKSKHKLLFWR